MKIAACPQLDGPAYRAALPSCKDATMLMKASALYLRSADDTSHPATAFFYR